MDIIKELMDIGFTDYESKVYAVLISGDVKSANAICKLTGVPRGRVYDVLGTLMNEGLCKLVPGAIKQYQALDPNDVFENILKRNYDDYTQKEHKIRELSQRLVKIHSEHNSPQNDFDCVSVYTAKSSIVQKSHEMVNETKSILRSLCKPNYLTPRKVEDFEEKAAPVLNAIARGIEFRSIYETEEDNMEAFIEFCDFFHEHGEIVRVINKLPLKLAINDTSAAMFTLFHKSITKNNASAMYIEHSDIVYALIDLFEYYWSLATPFEDFKLEYLSKHT